MARVRFIYILLLLGACAGVVFYWDYIAFVFFVLVAALPLLLFLPVALTAPFLRPAFWQSGFAAVRGQQGKITIRIQNRSIFPAPQVRLVISLHNRLTGDTSRETLVFPVGARNTAALETGVCAEHCGGVEIRLEKLMVADFLRLTSLTRRFGKKEGSCCNFAVLPASFPLSSTGRVVLAEDAESVRYHPGKPGDDPSQVFDTHEYREGDRLKNIHWKLSGKLGRLMVKEFSLPVSSRVRIALELNRTVPAGRLDIALDTCAAISDWLFQQDIAHEICWYDGADFSLARAGMEIAGDLEAALEKIYRAHTLAALPPKPHLLEELAQEGKKDFGNLIYISAMDISENQELLNKLAARMRVSACLVSAPGEIGEASMAPPDGETLSVYRLDGLEPGESLRDFSL